MDKNSWIGLLLIVAILFGWSYFTQPTEEEKAAQERRIDSIAVANKAIELEKALQLQQSKSEEKIVDSESINSETVAEDSYNLYGDFASYSSGKREFYTVENDLIKVTFSNLGGRIYSVELKEYQTYDSLPLLLFDGDSTEFGLNFFAQNRSISTDKLYFKLEEGTGTNKVTDRPFSLTYGVKLDDNKYIEYAYTINPGSYVVDFDINLKGMNSLITTNTGYLDLFWKSYLPSVEKGRDWEMQQTTVFYKFFEDEVESLSGRSESDSESLTTKVKWISFKQQFFNSTLIADNYFSNAEVGFEESVNPSHLKHLTSTISLPYDRKDNESSFPMSFYFGPNHYKTLKSLDVDLERIIELGMSVIRWMNVGVVIPLFNWLGKFISNYGLLILLMTIIIKVIIFPFTYKSYMSTAKMKALKPEVDKISEKFPKSEDAMKKQQATMALYKKVGVSPMGGCLPMLFQMPILLAMFRFFPNSIELRQQGFLWATDLSSYDSVLSLPFEIPFYGDHVSLFALLMTIVNFIYMKTNDQMNASNAQMPGMKMMMYMMPVMFMLILNNFSSGLTYYYFLANIITFGQNMLSKRFIDEEEVLKKLDANSKKTPKKSKFQQRLEAAAKQRGYSAPKK